MKKWLSLSLIAVIIVVGAFLVFKLVLGPKKIQNLEDIVAGDAVQYLYVHNLSGKVKEFCSSDFYQKLSGVSIYKKHIKPVLEKNPFYISFISELFENDTALAIFFAKPAELLKQTTYTNPQKILLLTRIGSASKKLAKILGEFYLSRQGQESDIIYEQYQGVKITIYGANQKDTAFSWALISDLAILSTDTEIIKKSIDLYKAKSQNSLTNNQYFKEITQKYASKKKDSLLWGFLNRKNYFKNFMDFFPELGVPSEAQAGYSKLKDYFKSQLDVFTGAIYFLNYDQLKEGLVTESYQFLDQDKVPETFISLFYPPRMIDRKMFKFIPQDIIGAYLCSLSLADTWTHLEKFILMINGIYGAAGVPKASYTVSGSGSSSVLAAIDSFLGVSLKKDILPLLGENFGFFLSGLQEIPVSSPREFSAPLAMFPLPVPLVSLAFEVKDPAQANRVLGDVIQHLVLQANIAKQMKAREFTDNPEKTEAKDYQLPARLKDSEESEEILKLNVQKYQGTDITYLTIKDSSLQPNYFILDNYFFISASLDFARKIIQTQKRPLSSLAAYFDLEEIKSKMVSPNYLVFFFDLQALIKELTKTQIFTFFRQGIPMFSQGKLTLEDLDSLVEVFKNIHFSLQTARMTEEAVMESLGYLEIEGL